MKKLFVLLFSLLSATALSADTDDDRPITFEELPAAAKTLIKIHFPEAKISIATVERGLWYTYDVIFTNGTKIEFSSSGEWMEIDCKYSHIPQGLFLEAITEFLREHHPDTLVTEADRDRSGYELKLDNRLEVSFDLAGRFRGYDD